MVATLILAIFMLIEDFFIWTAGKIGIPFGIVILGIVLLIVFHSFIFRVLVLILTTIRGILKI